MTGSARGQTVLLTGASGFIGGNLRKRLLADGFDVVALRRKSSPEPQEGRSAVVDYADLPGLEELVRAERPAFVFHVAGATKGVSYEDFRRANVLPTENLCRALESAEGFSRFVLVSSLAAYGPSRIDRPHTETDEPEPMEHYGRSKLEAERAAMSSKLPVTIIRPGGVYGPGDIDYFELFKSASKGLNVYFGNRRRYFSAVYVDDLIDAIVDAAQSEAAAGKSYFICDGHPVSWEDFQSVVVEASGRKVRNLDLPGFLVDLAALGGELATTFDKKPRLFNRQKAIMGRQDAWTCRHDAARADFGYQPKVDVREGVRRAFAWYRKEGWLPALPKESPAQKQESS